MIKIDMMDTWQRMKIGKMRSFLGREREGEKTTKVHNYPKGEKKTPICPL